MIIFAIGGARAEVKPTVYLRPYRYLLELEVKWNPDCACELSDQ